MASWLDSCDSQPRGWPWDDVEEPGSETEVHVKEEVETPMRLNFNRSNSCSHVIM